MPYQTAATNIIRESIKSAIFIDEKALEFYGEQSSEEIDEEKLSKELYSNFKDHGISLAVHKFKIKDIEDNSLKDYLFKSRDLILLDWKLNGEDGEEYSLNLLSEIVNKPHIHFCTIYTSETGKDLDNVFFNILSYFSGEDKDYYSELKEDLEHEEDILKLKNRFDDINLNRHSQKIDALVAEDQKDIVNLILGLTGEKDLIMAISKVWVALNDYHTSEIPLPYPSMFSFENQTLVINNTVISIMNKGENKPEDLISNLSSQIVNDNSSFSKLFGLDTNNLLRSNSSFIDYEIIDLNYKTMLFHRKQILEHGSEEEFNSFISSILLEQIKQNVNTSPLTLFNSQSCKDLEHSLGEVSDEELCKLNSFYNGLYIKDKSTLNFGDIFYNNESKTYFLCITALCDCLNPKNINNNFYFVEGNEVENLSKVLKSGDSGFKSYIKDGKVIAWSPISKQNDTMRYIKPFQLNIVSNTFENGKINCTIINEGKIEELNLTYIFTLKQNYAQRIANHAFGHPTRVGVDFVKRI